MSDYARSSSQSRGAGLTDLVGSRPDGRLGRDAMWADTPGSAVIISAFFIAMIIPVYFSFGTLRLSPYRLILVVAFLPLVVSWLAGACGRINKVDLLMLGFCGWSFIATLANHGPNQIQFSGMFIIETFGSYLLARRFIRTLSDFARIGRLLFWILLVFIPFGYIEATTRESVYISMFSFLGKTIMPYGTDIRWGLNRSQLAFEHPIIYGIFAASTFSVIYYTPRLKAQGVAGMRKAWATIWATFYSLSSGAYIPMGIQMLLMLYNWLFRSKPWRWKALAAVGVVSYVALDLASNRTPFAVLASKLAFSGSTYYWRVLIFQYGIQNVWADPLFGVGLIGWVRPYFMHTATVDNFWLVIAMRYGVPGFLLFAAAYAANIWFLVFAKLRNDLLSKQRYALVFMFLGLAAGISTVWLWNAVYVYFIFMLGAGAWLYDPDNLAKFQAEADASDTAADNDEAGPRRSRWTRQNKLHAQVDERHSAPGPAPKQRQERQYRRVKSGAAPDVKNERKPNKHHRDH